MLTLDLVRHGPALPASATGDAGRALSPEGRRLVERLGERLGQEGWAPMPAYVSPLLRARETAEILAGVVHGGMPIIVLPELHPDSDPGALIELLAPLLEPGSHTVLVGHQPLIGDLITMLTGESLGVSAGSLTRIRSSEPLARGGGRIERRFEPPRYT